MIGDTEVINRPVTDEFVIPILEFFNTKKDIHGKFIARIRITDKGDYSKLVIPGITVATARSRRLYPHGQHSIWKHK
eukprot:snap_masked-scaffold_4-processed-gene-13.22-mRNA-1 protein AED:1.00 eAED:1.00 QI:0/0/0/0/1/1/2/0/76